jgi:hypothetical protein
VTLNSTNIMSMLISSTAVKLQKGWLVVGISTHARSEWDPSLIVEFSFRAREDHIWMCLISSCSFAVMAVLFLALSFGDCFL